MTTTDDRAALHARLSAALEATLGADAVWTEVRCPRCGWTQALRAGLGCPRCIESVVVASMPRRPAALEDETDAEEAARYAWETTLRRQVSALADAVRAFPDWHPEWRLAPCTPVDWDDPAILWPRWERWATQWMQGPRPSPSILPMDVVQRTVRGAANAWAEVGVWTSRDGAPTVTAALATAWDALLAREGRDD